MDFNSAIRLKIERLKDMHDDKAEEYGDTISKPYHVFSKASPADRIKMMIDTKLSRIAQGEMSKEDSYMDLIVYLIHAWEMEFPEQSIFDDEKAEVWYSTNAVE